MADRLTVVVRWGALNRYGLQIHIALKGIMQYKFTCRNRYGLVLEQTNALSDRGLMSSISFWKSVLGYYLGLTIVVFLLFDLFPVIDGSQTFNVAGLIFRFPVAIGLAFLSRRRIRRLRQS